MSVDPDQRAKTYVAVLKHANIDVDWKAFASELGISTPGNAQRKFKDALKKDGFQFSGGKVTALDDADNTQNMPATSSKRKKTVASKPKSSAKKLKKSSEEDTIDDVTDKEVGEADTDEDEGVEGV